MFGKKARYRLAFATLVQAFVSGILMSKSTTLTTSGPYEGLLTHPGTSADNKLFPGSGANGSVVYLADGDRPISPLFPFTASKAISVTLSGRLDDLTIDLKGLSLTRVNIVPGTGGWTRNPERVNLFRGTIGILNVAARDSSPSHCQPKRFTATATANVQ